MLAAILLLPRLLAGGAEPPAGAIQLSVPQIERRPNEASATRNPWINSNGWRMLRSPRRSFAYRVSGDAAALAAAEAFTYDTAALISSDASGAESCGRMLEFLRQIPRLKLAPVADIGIIDDGSAETGEVTNLLGRFNLLYRIVKSPDKRLRVNVRLGTPEFPRKESLNPTLVAHKIRSMVGDENRSVRVYGSDVVISRLLAGARQARLHLINYSNRPIRGLRLRVRGEYSKGEARIFGLTGVKLQDWTFDGKATEFTIPELGPYAVVDLSK